MTEIAWKRTDLPAPLSELPEEVLSWAHGLYNAFVLAGSSAPIALALEQMAQVTAREVEDAEAIVEEDASAVELSGAPDARAERQAALDASRAALAALEQRAAILAEMLEEVGS